MEIVIFIILLSGRVGMDFEDDPVIAEQAKMMEIKPKGKKAKVQREGQKFDSANHEKEKQEMAKQNK